MIVSGIPVLFKSIVVNNLVYVTTYCMIMFFLGFMIAQIDIPLMYFMQNEIPEEYRGRVLSIGLSLGKIMQPIALAISGLLLNFIPAYTLPIAGDCIFTLNKILTNKLNLEIHSKDYSV